MKRYKYPTINTDTYRMNEEGGDWIEEDEEEQKGEEGLRIGRGRIEKEHEEEEEKSIV